MKRRDSRCGARCERLARMSSAWRAAQFLRRFLAHQGNCAVSRIARSMTKLAVYHSLLISLTLCALSAVSGRLIDERSEACGCGMIHSLDIGSDSGAVMAALCVCVLSERENCGKLAGQPRHGRHVKHNTARRLIFRFLRYVARSFAVQSRQVFVFCDRAISGAEDAGRGCLKSSCPQATRRRRNSCASTVRML